MTPKIYCYRSVEMAQVEEKVYADYKTVYNPSSNFIAYATSEYGAEKIGDKLYRLPVDISVEYIFHILGERYQPYYDSRTVFGSYYVNNFTKVVDNYVIVPTGKVECYVRNSIAKLYAGGSYHSNFKYNEHTLVIFGLYSGGISVKIDGKLFTLYSDDLLHKIWEMWGITSKLFEDNL